MNAARSCGGASATEYGLAIASDINFDLLSAISGNRPTLLKRHFPPELFTGCLPILAMARAASEGDVGLLRTSLCRAALFESAIHHRVHLVEPPACARCAAGSNVPAGGCAVLLQSQFHLILHAKKSSGRG